MANRKEQQHKYHPILRPAYDSYSSELTPHQEPVIVEGSNILVSRRGWIERRPGTAIYESTATNGNEWKRLYTYKKWNGDIFLMANEVTSSASKVYKLKVGTDTTFQLISSNASVSLPTQPAFRIESDSATSPRWTFTTSGACVSSDGVKTTNVIAAASNGGILYATFYFSPKFSIPTGTTIVGLQVDIELSASAGSEIEDHTIQLFNLSNRSGFGDNKARAAGTYWPATASEAVVSYGGAADLWGRSWTSDDVNDGLGVIVRAKDKAGGAGATAAIDRISMTLTVSNHGSAGIPFDFTTANDICYYSNGILSLKYDGSNERRWGVVPPAAPPSFTNAGTGITSTVGWKYVYTYVSFTGAVSSISPVSASTGVITDDTITVTGAFSTDSQVTTVNIYRTTDGGDGIFFYVGSVLNNSAGGTWTFDDLTPDTSLSTAYPDQAPPLTYNDPPPNMTGLKHWANRIWGYRDNALYYSGWEEINTGIEEECFPSDIYTGNVWFAPEFITNLAVIGTAENSFLLVFTASRIFKVTGDTRDTFEWKTLFEDMGSPIKNNKGVAEDGERVFWFNSDRRIWATDGKDKQLVSEAISDELAEVAFDDFSMVVHRYGEHNWLIVADNADDTKGLIATSATSPGTITDTGSNGSIDVPWTNPNNALVSDDTYATNGANISELSTANYLRASNFGFSVPSTATIQGVLFEAELKRTSGTANAGNRMRLVNSGTVIGSVQGGSSTITTTEQYISYGSSGTTWGYPLTPAIINGSGFGAELFVFGIASSANISLDHIRSTIYYTNGASSARWFVLDLNSGKWMPPWTLNAIYLHSAELAAGQKTLVYCSRDGSSANSQIRKVLVPPETAAYTDSSNLYSSDYVFLLEELAPPGFAVSMDTLTYILDGSKTTALNSGESPVVFFKGDEESAAVTWDSSLAIVDDLPSFASSAVASAAPTLYDRGTNLKDYVATVRKKCRKALIRFYWFGKDQNFRHFTLDYYFSLLGGDD